MKNSTSSMVKSFIVILIAFSFIAQAIAQAMQDENTQSITANSKAQYSHNATQAQAQNKTTKHKTQSITESITKGITNDELSEYFNKFINEYPALKWSGFFSNSTHNSPSNDTDTLNTTSNNIAKSGLHISNCVNNECDISYNDYTDYKSGFAPLPECYSSKKLVALDSTHAHVGDALLRISDDTLQIFGSISFTCYSSILEDNLARLGVKYEPFLSESYEITLTDSTLKAHFNYPINLNCIKRGRFSEQQLCAEPLLSDSYSFNQFFIFLAAQKADSFRYPDKIYISYRKMQSEISMCEHSKYYVDCIYAALGRFDSKVKDNLLIRDTPQIASFYKLLR